MLIPLFTSMISEEQKAQLKSAGGKIGEFMPMIQGYHDSIKLEKNEMRVSYLISIESEKIMLYQVVLAIDENVKKAFISRTLGKWDILEKMKELTNAL